MHAVSPVADQLLHDFKRRRVDLVARISAASAEFQTLCDEFQVLGTQEAFSAENLQYIATRGISTLEKFLLLVDDASDLLNDIRRYRNWTGVLQETWVQRMHEVFAENGRCINAVIAALQGSLGTELQGVERQQMEMLDLYVNILHTAEKTTDPLLKQEVIARVTASLRKSALSENILDRVFHTFRIKMVIQNYVTSVRKLFRDYLGVLENDMATYLQMGSSVIMETIRITRTEDICTRTKA